MDVLVSAFVDTDDQATAVANAAAEGVSLTGLRVLLVEDNNINQQIAVELLEGVGAQVRVVNNGRQAVDTLLGGPMPPPYDVVLMDLQMPIMSVNYFEHTGTQSIARSLISRAAAEI